MRKLKEISILEYLAVCVTVFGMVMSFVALRQSGEVNDRVSPETMHHHHLEEANISQDILNKYPSGDIHVHIFKDGTQEVHFNSHPSLQHHK